MTRPLPDVNDPDFAPFWAGTRSGELRLVFCRSCSACRWPPRPICRHCHSLEFEWRPVGQLGMLYTWTIVERQTTPGMPPPYAVGLIVLNEYPDIRVLGDITDADLTKLEVGMAMHARFEALDSSVTLVNWSPTRAQGAR